MERCTSCGSALTDAAQFCGYCGRVVITMREMPTRMRGYPVMNALEDDTPPYISGSPHPVPPSFLSSGEYGDSSIRSMWPKGEMTQQMPASEEEEYEEEERRALLDTPDAASESWPPSFATAPLANPSSSPRHTGTGSGSTRRSSGSRSGALVALILAVVCLIIMGTIASLFSGAPPAISVVGSSDVTIGEGLHLHGYHFFPGSSITFTLDNRLQLFSSARSTTGETLGFLPAALQVNVAGQPAAQNMPVKTDGSGSFDLTIPVSTAWGLGLHSLRATEGISSRSAVVNFTVEAAARLLAEPSILDFGKLMVGSKAVLSVAVNNNGGQPLNWKATTGGETWLKLAPDVGRLQVGASLQFIYVTVNASRLKVGSYFATLTINSNGGRAQVSLVLQVIPQGQKPQAKLSVTPNELDFGSLDVGHQLNKAIIVSNSGNLALNWKADTGNANWVTLDTSSQTIQPGALPDTINVTVDTTNLAPGNQSATLTISSNAGSAQVAITLAVNQPAHTPYQPPCTLSAPSSSNQTFNARMGTNPAAQTLTIGVSGTCSSGVTITPTVTTASGKGWLAVSPPAATLTNGSATFTVNVASSALVPGSYTGTIALAAESGNTAINSSPHTVGVTLTVTEVPPVLAVSTTTLAFSLSNGDSITPEPFTISNTGGAPLNWTASRDANAPSFVSLSAGAGTNLAGGTNATVNVNVKPSGVEAGNYAATVTISAIDPITGQGVKGSGTTLSVTITITAQPAIQPSEKSLTFTPGNCMYTASSTITIMNTDGSTLSLSLGDPVYPSGSPTGWLSVASTQDTGNSTLKFSVDGTGSQLVNGQIYTATVTITPSAGTPQTISVSFTMPYCNQS